MVVLGLFKTTAVPVSIDIKYVDAPPVLKKKVMTVTSVSTYKCTTEEMDKGVPAERELLGTASSKHYICIQLRQQAESHQDQGEPLLAQPV